MSATKVYIATVGTGGVGRAFLSQLTALLATHSHLHPVLIARSSKTLSTPAFTSPLSLTTWSHDLSTSAQPPSSPSDILTYLLSNLSRTAGKAILVDNTSDQALADAYPKFLEKGISIVTPNKKAFSAPLTLFRAIRTASYPTNPHGGFIYHESTVGAGLPILSTLTDLVATGDKVLKIEGVFSGTMSFLFNSFAPLEGQGGKWSAEVAKAKELGYTEPDPRDDLNGLDVARKLVILARVAGLEIEDTASFPVQSLIPQELESCKSADEFMARLPEFDAQMSSLRDEAAREGKVVRFVGSIDVVKKECKVGVEKFDKGNAIAGLKGSDNVIAFTTERYGGRPLIVQGAGAGAEVTAMGVTADLIKVMQRIS